MSLAVGLHEDVSHEQYHADPCEIPSLSASIAHQIVTKSPLHAWQQHPRLGGDGAQIFTDAMDRGTIRHKLLLGRGQDFAEIEEANYRSGSAQRARDGARADGLIPVLTHELEEHQRVVAIYRQKLRDRKQPIVFEGPSEVTGIFLRDGVLCRMRIDHWNKDEMWIDDVKTCKSASPREIASSMFNFGADVQHAMYTGGLGILIPQLADRVRMRFIYLEADPPYDVVVAEPDGQMQELGRKRLRRAIDAWAGCIGANVWPGYADEMIRVAPPPWAESQDLDRALNAMKLQPPPF